MTHHHKAAEARRHQERLSATQALATLGADLEQLAQRVEAAEGALSILGLTSCDSCGIWGMPGTRHRKASTPVVYILGSLGNRCAECFATELAEMAEPRHPNWEHLMGQGTSPTRYAVGRLCARHDDICAAARIAFAHIGKAHEFDMLLAIATRKKVRPGPQAPAPARHP